MPDPMAQAMRLGMTESPGSLLNSSGTSMRTLASIIALSALLLSGCATTQPDKSASAPAPAAAAPASPPAVQAAAITKPVPVPAASAKTLTLNMTGPRNVTEARDWAAFKEEWRATFAEHAKQQGVAFSMQEGPARPAGSAGTLLAVHVNDYRMVGIGARIFFGVMTGNAYIDAKAVYQDLQTGAPFGDQAYNTTSTAWHGIFGKMTPQQVDTIAADVMSHLKAAK